MKNLNRRDFLGCAAGGAAGTLLAGCEVNSANNCSPQKARVKRGKNPLHRLTPTPPLGWNSYNCWGNFATEKILRDNLEVFAKRLKPYGYEYFVVDAGWYSEYKSPATKDARLVRIDEYGRYLPSKYWLPNGLQPLIDRAHDLDVKFGVWLIRGVSRKAVELNLPIKGTKYSARDIANTNDICSWFDCNFGVDMDKPGAQEYYNSIIDLLAEWGIDFVKYDNIEADPREVEAVANACENCGRDIVLSLSHGTRINKKHMDSLRRANMLRISYDMWDQRRDHENTFLAWEMYQEFGGDGFWLDMDMVPFGHLAVWNPWPKDNKLDHGLLSTLGYDRMDYFTIDQKQCYMTQRAMAASSLFMGGDLPTSDEVSFELITNKEMLACNQNGVVGQLYDREGHLDIWKTPHKTKSDHGWVGIFNRGEAPRKFSVSKCDLGLKKNLRYKFYDIWKDRFITDEGKLNFDVGKDGVAFLRYHPA